jgi:hypothetical protein
MGTRFIASIVHIADNEGTLGCRGGRGQLPCIMQPGDGPILEEISAISYGQCRQRCRSQRAIRHEEDALGDCGRQRSPHRIGDPPAARVDPRGDRRFVLQGIPPVGDRVIGGAKRTKRTKLMLKASLMPETSVNAKLSAASRPVLAVPAGPRGTGTTFASIRNASDAQKFFTSSVSNILTGSAPALLT